MAEPLNGASPSRKSSSSAASTTTLLKAFARYRWQTLRNRLRGERRGTVMGKISDWLGPALRILTWMLILPLIALVAGGSALGGWFLASQDAKTSFLIFLLLRLVLIAVTVMTLLAPLFVGGGAGDGEQNRLLLLPISRRDLHAVQLVSTLTDPWLLVGLTIVIFLAVGMAANALVVGGFMMLLASAAVLAAGLFWIAATATLGFWVYLTVLKIMQDRRRADRFVFIGLLTMVVVGFFPMFFLEEGGPAAPISDETAELLFWANPLGELFVFSVRAVAEGKIAATLGSILAACLIWLGLMRLSEKAYERLLTSGGSRTRRSERGSWIRADRIPGLSPQIAAVAVAQLRTFTRTVPGKMMLLQAPLMAFFGGLMHNRLLAAEELPDFGIGFVGLEIILLAIAMSFSTFGMQQTLFNQYAVDRAGLTLQCLLPLSGGDLLRGKAWAWTALQVWSFALSLVVVVFWVRPAPSSLLWSCAFVLLGAASCHLLMASAGFCFAALFPREADLGKPLKQNQPHPISAFGGLAIYSLAAGIPGGFVLLGLYLGRPFLALGILILWAICAALVARQLERLALLIWARRRESVLMIAQGR